jgi:thioesterase domain-containing protein/acyl carrier protein
MIPQHFISLDALPLTPSGKIDRKKLPSLRPEDAVPGADFIPPRSAIEMQLTGIWEKTLNVRPIGIRDNFFDLGGHSLLAVKLFTLIDKNMGAKLPLSILFQSPTIEQLAESIQQNNWEPKWSSLVSIRPGGTKPPLFLMHGAGGNVLLYQALVRHLDKNQPVYGFQSQGLDGKRNIFTTIEEMASHYISEMLTIQPDGPYYLAGYCMGGQIAYEMACQLYKMGHRVALLAMLDTQSHWLMNRNFIACSHHILQNILFHLKNFMMADNKGKFVFAKEKFTELLRRIKQRCNIALSIIEYKLNTRKELPLKLMEKINDRAAIQYIAPPYPGKVVLFQPKTMYDGYTDPLYGWGNGLTAGVECCKLSAYPAGILVDPYVSELAEKLNECLEKARSTAWNT